MSARVATGLDRIAQGDAHAVRMIKGRRVGLLAHPASVTASFLHARDALIRAGAKLTTLFGPEHGFLGGAQDMVSVGAPRAKTTDDEVRVFSLYGDTFDSLRATREMVAGLDAVVVDLQDVGSRYYTFVWSAGLMLQSCAKAGIQTIILDRPNPLGGRIIEGGVQRDGFRSFVGLYDVAVRHGLTIAEVVELVRRTDGISRDALSVIEMQGWSRDMSFEETGLPWVLPSPNMPTCDTARVYPGGCLLEGTSFSEGRGTTRPFELWGAPSLDARALARGSEYAGLHVRATDFEPTFHKHAKTNCSAVQVHVTDARSARTYYAYLSMIARAARLCGEAGGFKWRTERYEFVDDIPAIDLLTGGPEFRAAASSNNEQDYVEAERLGAARWGEERSQYLFESYGSRDFQV